MTTRRPCPFCGARPAITPNGAYWTHGRPACEGSRRPAKRGHHWPTRHHGRRVITIPGPDTWNLEENAA